MYFGFTSVTDFMRFILDFPLFTDFCCLLLTPVVVYSNPDASKATILKENKKKKKEKRENLKPDDDNVQKMNFGRGRRDWRARSFRGFVFEGGRKRKGRVGDVCGRKSDEI